MLQYIKSFGGYNNMNDNTRFLMGIYQVALLIENSLDYSVMINFKDETERKAYEERYEVRGRVFDHFLAEGSPMDYFCKRNSRKYNPEVAEENDKGTKIMSQLQEFSTDVYGNNRKEDSNTPVVSIIKNAVGEKEVHVESSRINHLFDMIVGLNQTVSETIVGHLNYFEKDLKDPQEDFRKLFEAYDQYYRANYMTAVCINIANKFDEYNRAARAAIDTARQNGVDVNSPEFKLENDPTVYFVRSELQQLLGYADFCMKHTIYLDDELKQTYANYTDSLNYFNGTKAIPEGKTLVDVLNEFCMTFNKYLVESTKKWQPLHEKMYNELVEYENAMREQMAKGEAPAAEAESDKGSEK